MKNTEDILISLLKAYISGNSCEEWHNTLTDETLKKLYETASHHSIEAMLSDVLIENKLIEESELKDECGTCLMLSVLKYQYQNIELINICKLFEENKISHIPLKGAVLKKYYSKPWLRTSCDIDILVHPEELDCATDVLINHGYVLEKNGSHDVAIKRKNKVRLELHYDVIEKECNIGKVDEVLSKIWEYASPKEGHQYEYVLSNEMFYFYHIAHMAKHFIHGGCGVRTFLDTWILNNKLEFNNDKKLQLLKDGGISGFAAAAEKLSNVCFSNDAQTDLTDEMQFFVFRGGTYGNLENHIAMKQVKEGSKLKHALSKIFLKYDVIKFHYPVLKKHKYLLPYFEVCRWCKLIFNKSHRTRSLEHLSTNRDLSGDLKSVAGDLLTKLEL